MNKLKEHWGINQNWQLIFIFLGLMGLTYSSYTLVASLTKNAHIILTLLLSIPVFFLFLKLTLLLFDKLEKKWNLNYRWELISVFLVFAITGSSSVFISKPLIKFIGINKETFSIYVYWLLYVVIGFIFYQILLISIGWLFGQFNFFWNFEKKMLRRIGLKRFLES